MERLVLFSNSLHLNDMGKNNTASSKWWGYSNEADFPKEVSLKILNSGITFKTVTKINARIIFGQDIERFAHFSAKNLREFE